MRRPGRVGWSMHHFASGVLLGETIGNLPGAIRRAVVDHQHAEAVAGEHAFDEHRQVRSLVVRRDHNEHARSAHRRVRPARPEAQTINVGSITGILNRSCGKKMRHISTAEPASKNRAAGGCCARTKRRAPAIAKGSRSRYGTADAARYLVECSA